MHTKDKEQGMGKVGPRSETRRNSSEQGGFASRNYSGLNLNIDANKQEIGLKISIWSFHEWNMLSQELCIFDYSFGHIPSVFSFGYFTEVNCTKVRFKKVLAANPRQVSKFSPLKISKHLDACVGVILRMVCSHYAGNDSPERALAGMQICMWYLSSMSWESGLCSASVFSFPDLCFYWSSL